MAMLVRALTEYTTDHHAAIFSPFHDERGCHWISGHRTLETKNRRGGLQFVSFMKKILTFRGLNQGRGD
jgi:hypothetical protein